LAGKLAHILENTFYIKFMSFKGKKIKIFVSIGIRFLAVVFLLGHAGVVYSRADTASPVAGETSTTPIHIVSDRMEANIKEKWIAFIGNVVATQEDAVVQAERLKIFYISDNSAAANADAIKKIIADGNVKIVTGIKTATGDHAVYTADDHVLILTGHSKAWSGENVVAGSKITLFLDEDRSIVESDTEEQVEATFYPKKQGGLLQ
jgi:lipopolysaccharide export system protein LptA